MSDSGRAEESIGSGTNELVIFEPGAAETEHCFDLLTGGDPADRFVLVVDYVDESEPWINHWQDRVGEFPAQLRFVSVQETSWDETREQTAEPATSDPRFVKSVIVPDDLTGLGIAINEYLTEWESAKWEAGSPTEMSICFDSLTLLFQYAGFDRGFRFLHEMTQSVTEVGGHAHYHITAGAHDEQQVATLSELFDDATHVE